MNKHEFSVMVLVKAAPVLTSQLNESMCVAAMTLDEDPRWIRLHPVPFRDLDQDSKFKKYQEINVAAIRSKDRRPESWKPIEGSISLGSTIGVDHGWSTRRERVAKLGSQTMCELRQRNRSGSGPGTPSLAVVHTIGPPELIISRRDEEQINRWQELADAHAAQPSLFDGTGRRKQKFEVVPWRFRYRYHCIEPGCKGHRQTIIDWEAAALWRKIRHRTNWEDLMRSRFVGDMWGPSKDTVLFVGNMEQKPWNFLVLGVFWPPHQSVQGSLLE